MDHEDGDGDGAGLDGGVDGDSGGGMEEPSGGDSGGVSPLRSSPAAAFCLLFPKTDPCKLLGHLDVVWVPESQKDGKRGFLILQG